MLTPRSFGIVPAAGRSERMGTAKLLLPWGDKTVIEHVLSAWQASRVTHVTLVVRPDDQPLANLGMAAGVDVVRPATAPAEMKISIRLALAHVGQRFAPTATDCWLLAPADMPRLEPALIDRLLAEHRAQHPAILVPTFAGRRGHPVLFPWPLAAEVEQLAAHEGVNALLARHPVREIFCDHPEVLDDLDTPDDYARLRHSDA
jgi:molybdenum cofactor cytidylyltransferase